MTGSIITVIAVVAGIGWLAFVFVAAIRNRGKEEIAPNLRPGITDAVLETKRLETGQKAAIAFSAFLAISLPLYFLSEPARQEGFVEQFDEESIRRGEHIVTEFACFSCHGPEGVGGVAGYLEKRSGITVSWLAPPLNDVLYRYDEDELNFWITFGRGNTPMPAWGLAGGGPLSELQVIDVVNYLRTIQVPQSEAVNRSPDPVKAELDKLANADAILASAIVKQEQVVAEIEQAEEDARFLVPLADELKAILDESAEEGGLDTDDDGLTDTAEADISALSVEIVDHFTVVEPVVMDPNVADAEKADEAVDSLTAALATDPIVGPNLDAVSEAIEAGQVAPGGLGASATEALDEIAAEARELGATVPEGPYDTVEAGEALVVALDDAAQAEEAGEDLAGLASSAAEAVEEGADADGDGLSTGAEKTITAQVAQAGAATVPSQVKVMELDPTNPETTAGTPDLKAATVYVGGIQSLATSLRVSAQNSETLLENEEAGLEFLEQSAQERAFEIDFAGVADAMGVDLATAERAVGLFNANCARCHTASFSAGVPFTGEAGNGGFGPALWDGRPAVQFGREMTEPAQDDLLVQFLVRGSVAQRPYGINGFGSGRMPGFGFILPTEDIQLLALYLRSGNLDGKG